MLNYDSINNMWGTDFDEREALNAVLNSIVTI